MKKILIVDDGAENIAEKFRKALQNYKPGELSVEEAAQFDRMARIEQANKEFQFCLPPCKKFPNCDCVRHNKKIRMKYRL